MDPRAIMQATERLNRVRRAIEGMKQSSDPNVVELHWVDFLTAAKQHLYKARAGSETERQKQRLV